MEEAKKKGIITKFIGFIWGIFILLIPAIRLLSYNKHLKHCSRIVKNEVWFSQQRSRNYILSIVLMLPLAFCLYRGVNIVSNDLALTHRMTALERGVNPGNFVSNYIASISETERDSFTTRQEKIDSKSRLLAFLLLLGFGGSFSLVMGLMVLFFHPTTYNSKILKKLLIQNGAIHKDDADKAIVFATPIGFLVDIVGTAPRELASMDRIWAGLNIRIKDWIEDPKKRTTVFFRKSYELQDTYMYDKIE